MEALFQRLTEADIDAFCDIEDIESHRANQIATTFGVPPSAEIS